MLRSSCRGAKRSRPARRVKYWICHCFKYIKLQFALSALAVSISRQMADAGQCKGLNLYLSADDCCRRAEPRAGGKAQDKVADGHIHCQQGYLTVLATI
jgi:hypothetical protein